MGIYIVDNRLDFRNDASNKAQSIIISNDDCSRFLAGIKDLVKPDDGSLQARPSNVLNFDGSRSSPTPSDLRSTALRSLTNFGLAEYAGRVSSSGQNGRDGDFITYATTSWSHGTVVFANEFYGLSPEEAALTVIHESLHLYSGFSDQALASAISIYGRPDGSEPRRDSLIQTRVREELLST